MSYRVALLPLLAILLGCAFFRELPAWEKPPPPARDAPVVDAARLHRAELPNGMRVLVLEDPRLPRFQIGVVARRGAGIVAPEQAGLAELTAELMERGAGDQGALELAAVVDNLGASLSVSAGWDSMAAGVSGLSRDLDTLFIVLTDVVRRPRFEAEEAARVREWEARARAPGLLQPASPRSPLRLCAGYRRPSGHPWRRRACCSR